MSNLRGSDLWDRDRINEKISSIEAIPDSSRTVEDKRMFSACKETMIYDPNITYFLFAKEKGGRVRLAPIIGLAAEQTIERVKNTPSEKKVWNYVNVNADIHSYRADYAKNIYRISGM